MEPSILLRSNQILKHLNYRVRWRAKWAGLRSSGWGMAPGSLRVCALTGPMKILRWGLDFVKLRVRVGPPTSIDLFWSSTSKLRLGKGLERVRLSIQTKYGVFRLQSLPLVRWPSRAEQLSQSQPKVPGRWATASTLYISVKQSPLFSEHLNNCLWDWFVNCILCCRCVVPNKSRIPTLVYSLVWY